MKHLFLTSQFYHVADSISAKLAIQPSTPLVFINTCLADKVRPDSELDWHHKNIVALKNSGFDIHLYDITGKAEDQIKSDLAKYKYMYVEGGNTFYLLKQSGLCNFAQFVTNQVNYGMVYISTSAGSVIAGIDTTSNGRPGKTALDYGLTNSLGYKLVNFNILPHWGSTAKKDAYLHFKIPQSYKEDFPSILLTDHQYIEVIDNSFQIINTQNNHEQIS